MQSRFDGVSMRYSVADASAPSARRTQFYSMLGSRGIWHDGWKAVTTHPTISGWSNFNDDTWELYHTDTDRAELHDLAAEHPEKVRELVNLWFAEAGDNGAFPLDDRSALEIILTPRPQLTSPRDRYVYFPGTCRGARAAGGEHPQPVLHRSARWWTSPRPARRACCSRTARGSAGTRCTSRTAGCTTSTTSSACRAEGHGTEDSRRREPDPVGLVRQGRRGSAGGLHRDPVAVPRGQEGRRGPDQDPAGKLQLAGEGLCVGRDSGEPVTADYPGDTRIGSPAAPSSGSRSTSAASPTSTWSARPRQCWRGNKEP